MYFLSYARNDEKAAKQLKQRLETHGYSIWVDSDELLGGADWPSELIAAITKCKGLILLITPNSMSSENVTKEVQAAIARSKPVIPVECIAAEYPNAIDYHLRTIHRTKFDDTEELLKALGSELPHQHDNSAKLAVKMRSIRDNQPRLAFDGISSDPRVGIGWSFPIRNSGGSAFEMVVESLDPLGSFRLSEDEVRTGELIHLIFTVSEQGPKPPLELRHAMRFPFILKYADIENNSYTQPSSLDFGHLQLGKALPKLD